MAFIMMTVAPQVPRLVARFGAARVVPFGLGSIALGLAAFSQVGVDSSIWHVYMAIVPLALGMATTMTPLTTLIMSAVPLGKAGVGSAMNDTTRELGGALGVAVLGSVVTSQYTASLASSITGLPAQARQYADTGLTGALQVAQQIGGEAGARLTAAAQQALVDGLSAAGILGAVVVAAASVAAWFLLPRGAQVPAGAVPGVPGEGAHPDAAGDVVDDGAHEPSPVIDGDGAIPADEDGLALID
jgi:hypothetical protein